MNKIKCYLLSTQTEEELEAYALREENNWPLVNESIRHFE